MPGLKENGSKPASNEAFKSSSIYWLFYGNVIAHGRTAYVNLTFSKGNVLFNIRCLSLVFVTVTKWGEQGTKWVVTITSLCLEVCQTKINVIAKL